MKTTQQCDICLGDGTLGENNSCPKCDGSGVIEYDASEVETKLDAIIAEQASQREDLTTALNQIWNKIKDL